MKLSEGIPEYVYNILNFGPNKKNINHKITVKCDYK